MIDDRTLLAYVDGELDPGRAAAIERMLASDPDLAAKLERHRRLARRLREAYDPVLRDAIPDGLARAASGGAKVISLSEARAARAAKPARQPNWLAPGLVAAGLLAALVVGQAAIQSSSTGPVAERAGRLVAAGDLAHALDSQLSGDGRTVRVQLTFRDRAGAICRSFAGVVASGVACRRDAAWALQALFPGQAATGGEASVAAGSDPRVRRAVSEMIGGEAFDAAQERAARTRHWTQ